MQNNAKFIGRSNEREVLLNALDSWESEMVAVIGRRRVGKTFLVREAYADGIDVEIAGVQHASEAIFWAAFGDPKNCFTNH